MKQIIIIKQKNIISPPFFNLVILYLNIKRLYEFKFFDPNKENFLSLNKLIIVFWETSLTLRGILLTSAK